MDSLLLATPYSDTLDMVPQHAVRYVEQLPAGDLLLLALSLKDHAPTPWLKM